MKLRKVHDRRVKVGAGAEFLVIDRQDKGTGARLLLGKFRQIAVAGDTQHFEALILDRFGHRADAKPRRIFRPEVFVDDDDGKAELHEIYLGGNVDGKRAVACMGFWLSPPKTDATLSGDVFLLPGAASRVGIINNLTCMFHASCKTPQRWDQDKPIHNPATGPSDRKDRQPCLRGRRI